MMLNQHHCHPRRARAPRARGKGTRAVERPGAGRL